MMHNPAKHSAAPAATRCEPVDDRLAFLARAGVRHDMVERGDLEVDEAFDALIDQFLRIVFPLPELHQWAEALWDNPGWSAAAREYHEQLRGRQSLSPLVVKISEGKAVFHPDLKFYRRLMDDDISLDGAYRAIERRAGGDPGKKQRPRRCA